jgi:hypothetical protein
MLAANRSLIHLISRLMSDADEREMFHGDEEGYLRRHGLDDVSGEDIADAMPFVFEDLADDAVAARFTAYAGGEGPGEGFDLSRSLGAAPPRPPMRLQGESDLESAVRHLNHITTVEAATPLDDAIHVRDEVIDSSFKREILGSRVTRFLDDDRLDEFDTGNGDDGHLAAVGVGAFGGRGDPAAVVDADGYSLGHVAPGDHTSIVDRFDAGDPLPEPGHVDPPDPVGEFDPGSGGGGSDALLDTGGGLDTAHVALDSLPGAEGEWVDGPAEAPEVPVDLIPPEHEAPEDSVPVPEPDPEPDLLADPFDGIG